MTATLQDFVSVQGVSTGTCKTCSLPADIRAQVDAMVRDGHMKFVGGTVSSAVVARWIKETAGVSISRSSIQRHQAEHA